MLWLWAAVVIIVLIAQVVGVVEVAVLLCVRQLPSSVLGQFVGPRNCWATGYYVFAVVCSWPSDPCVVVYSSMAGNGLHQASSV